MILCMNCRSSFTEEQTERVNACPSCGDVGVPANTDEVTTATLTHHEWRILCMWAGNYAESIGKGHLIDGIRNEIRRQDPNAPPLSLAEEVAGLRAQGYKVEVEYGDGRKDTGLN